MILLLLFLILFLLIRRVLILLLLILFLVLLILLLFLVVFLLLVIFLLVLILLLVMFFLFFFLLFQLFLQLQRALQILFRVAIIWFQTKRLLEKFGRLCNGINFSVNLGWIFLLRRSGQQSGSAVVERFLFQRAVSGLRGGGAIGFF